MHTVLVTHLQQNEASIHLKPLRELFLGAWSTLRGTMARYRSHGYAIAAVDRVTGEALEDRFLPVVAGNAAPLIVGRGGRCDLPLPADPSISSRHLAMIAHAMPDNLSGESCRLFVVDLRTMLGFDDEHGTGLRVLTADRAAMVTVGRHALFAVRAEHQLIETTRADAAWTRVRAPTSDAHPTVALGPRPVPRNLELVEPVTTLPNMALVGDNRSHGELLGTLVISSKSPNARPQVIRVHAEDAEAGLLIGRNPRCHTSGDNGLGHPGVSRVHLLVVRLGARVVAVDLASTNGTFLVSNAGAAGDRTRSVVLAHGTELVLGESFTTVRWEIRAHRRGRGIR